MPCSEGGGNEPLTSIPTTLFLFQLTLVAIPPEQELLAQMRSSDTLE
jgi:hypothetical protein